MSPSRTGDNNFHANSLHPGRKKCKLHQLRPTHLTSPSTNGPQKLPTTFQPLTKLSCFAFNKAPSSKLAKFFDTLAGWLPHLAIPNSMQCTR